MNRQDQFERVYAHLTGREVEAIKAMRFRIIEGYASPKIADAYRVFCAAHQNDLMVDFLEALENLLWHAEQIEQFQESERGKGLSVDQLYEAGEMNAYMVTAKELIARAKGEQV